jgi:hypothetical protein
MKGILERQNSSPFLRLLRARAHIYMGAGRLQWIQFALSVVVPMIGAIAGIIWVETRPWIGVLALAITICDVSWLDRMQRRKFRTLAKVGEQFDCELLGLPWNAFTVGKYVDPETIDAAASGWSGGDAYLMDWYPQEVARSSRTWHASFVSRPTYGTTASFAEYTVPFSSPALLRSSAPFL